MKKRYIIWVIILLCNAAQAKIWRVNNNTGIAADFTNAQAAHDGAAMGDTLHFEPSLSSYGNVMLSKRLVLIGTGDFLDINPNQQSTGIAARLSDLNISNPAAAGTVIMVSFSYMIIQNVPNLVIQRCYISNLVDANNADNMVIRNCYFQNNINIQSGSANILVHNNIIRAHISMDAGSSGTILNNVISTNGNGSLLYNSIVRSNIFVNGGVGLAVACTIENNLESGSSLPAGSGNQSSVSMSTVFINHSSGLDKDFQLKAGSPAIAAGYGGIDAGAYGGLSPYVLSVLPNVPSVYKLIAPPSVSGNTMSITISTKSNN
ncbi:MAG TPA: hypothetical protein VD996_08660 [Chitinophagaceae bacterium]|nr:hypothetical protein [Chitinophagaceae bacterium]